VRIISFGETGLAGDNRKRSLDETARVELQIYVTIPAATLRKLSSPGHKMVAGDVLNEKLAESSSVGELLRKIDRYTDGAIVRVSGR